MKKESQKLVFDYIIVGTGPAGAVISKTLSDDLKTSVLVLEAGEKKGPRQTYSRFRFCFGIGGGVFPAVFLAR